MFHGLPESTGSTGVDYSTGAIMQVVGSLGVQLDPGCIDRCHRMGRTSSESAGTPHNPRPVIFLRTTQSYFHRQAQAQGNKVCNHRKLVQATSGPTPEGPRFFEH